MSAAKNSQTSSKNQEAKKENRVCEKIFRAMTSPIRTVRYLSNKPSPNHHQTGTPVRVKFSATSTQAAKPISKMEPLITRVETKLKTDERFTDYIKKAKLKIRAVTNLGDMMRNDASETSETEARDHHHHHRRCHVRTSSVSSEGSSGRSSDHFSEYIRKAKMKLRSSTISRANPTYKD